MNDELQYRGKGGEDVFGEELMIGSVRTQVNRLNEMLTQLELDGQWKNHSLYYAREIRDVERRLRAIRKADFETAYKGNPTVKK